MLENGLIAMSQSAEIERRDLKAEIEKRELKAAMDLRDVKAEMGGALEDLKAELEKASMLQQKS